MNSLRELSTLPMAMILISLPSVIRAVYREVDQGQMTSFKLQPLIMRYTTSRGRDLGNLTHPS